MALAPADAVADEDAFEARYRLAVQVAAVPIRRLAIADIGSGIVAWGVGNGMRWLCGCALLVASVPSRADLVPFS